MTMNRGKLFDIVAICCKSRIGSKRWLQIWKYKYMTLVLKKENQ